MCRRLLYVLALLSCPIVGWSIEWPVFFERLGNVHSVHNKWDLVLRVHVDLPSLQAKLSKIRHRLSLLDNEFRDPDLPPVPPNRRRNSIPSRLDELNLSWKEQNTRLSLRCDSIGRRSDNLQELGEHQLYTDKRGRRKRKRRKRQAVVGEGLLKAFFGVAYTGDVNNLKTRVDNLDTRLSGDVNDMRTQTNNLRSTTNEMINRQSRQLRRMEDLAGKLTRKVTVMETNPFMKTSISDLVHVRNEAYKRLALEVDLIDERLVEIESIVTTLASGRLSQSIISPKKLQESLRNIDNQLPANYSLLFSADAGLWPYYATISAAAVFDSDLEDVVVTLSVPLIDRSAALELHRVHNLPLKVKDGYSVIADLSTEYLVTDKSKEYYLELFKEDFADCQVYHQMGEQNFYCGLQPLLRADIARSCVMQLFQGQSDPAWCQSRLRHGLIQPYHRLYNGSWIFAALTHQVPVTLQCPDGDTSTGLVGFGVIQLGDGCTITSDEFWYAHTFAGVMEVNIDFNKDDEWLNGVDVNGREEDYDVTKFKDDAIFEEFDDALIVDTERKDEVTEDSTEKTGGGNKDDQKNEEDANKKSNLTSREQNVKTGLKVKNPVDKESATQVYKDLLIKLKKKLSNNWIHIT